MNRINFNLSVDKQNLNYFLINREEFASWIEAVLVIEEKLQEIDERILQRLIEKGNPFHLRSGTGQVEQVKWNRS